MTSYAARIDITHLAGVLDPDDRNLLAHVGCLMLARVDGKSPAEYLTELERERAEKVSGFLQDLFAVPDPGQSQGETITAREMLDRGAEQIIRDLEDQPELQAELMETMGRAYRNLGLYAPARNLLERSLAARRAHLDRDDPRIADSLQALAFLLRKTGNDAAAEPLAFRVREEGGFQVRDYQRDAAERSHRPFTEHSWSPPGRNSSAEGPVAPGPG